MKTVEEWFNCLRPDLRDKAIANTHKGFLNDIVESLSYALRSSFAWCYSNEGLEFWQNIYQEVKDIEEGIKPNKKKFEI